MDDLEEMSSSSLKRILWNESIPKDEKLTLVEKYLPEEAIECLKEEKIL
jgi:hypothetical protein